MAEEDRPPKAEVESAASPEAARAVVMEPDSANPTIAAALQASIERERWLQRRFEAEHRVLVTLMRLLLTGLGTESRAMRFWRWLIDDLRSERRMIADATRATDQEGALLSRVNSWMRSRGIDTNDPGPPRLSDPGGIR